MTKFKWTFLALLCGILLSCDKETRYINLPAYGPQQEFLALSSNNVLTIYNAADVRNVGAKLTITGLAASERVIDMDFRPATGELYGVTNQNRIYIIDTSTGLATAVSATAFSELSNRMIVSIDFNPTADLLRVVTNNGQNLRVNPETGVLVGTDGNLTSNNILGIAYSNNFAGSTSTVLYDLNPISGQLFRQSPPNDGTLVAVGNLGADLGTEASFDIAPNNANALAVGKVGDSTKLYTIDLTNGKATLSGKFKANTDIKSIAIATNPVAYAVDQTGNLLAFDPTLTAPTFYSKALSGLQPGETILGMDFRVLNGRLYALGSSNRLYTINLGTGVVTQVGTGTFATPLNGTSFGFDFNPINNLIRVVSNTGQSLNIDPATAAITAGPTTPTTAVLGAAAFDNNFRAATTTSLYVVDLSSNKLFTSLLTTGALTAVGELKVPITATHGFDISAENVGYGVFTEGTKTSLYTVSLGTGLAAAKFAFNTPITAFTIGLYR